MTILVNIFVYFPTKLKTQKMKNKCNHENNKKKNGLRVGLSFAGIDMENEDKSLSTNVYDMLKEIVDLR